MTGWAQVGRAIAELPEAKTDFIICGNRQLTARLAFYIPGHPRTYQMDVNPARVTSQYQVWPGYGSFVGRDAICVVEAKRKQKPGPDGKPAPPRLNPLLARQFKQVDPPIWPTARDARGQGIYHAAVYIAHDYLGQRAPTSQTSEPAPPDDEDE